jgi:hypothetical protein
MKQLQISTLRADLQVKTVQLDQLDRLVQQVLRVQLDRLVQQVLRVPKVQISTSLDL